MRRPEVYVIALLAMAFSASRNSRALAVAVRFLSEPASVPAAGTPSVIDAQHVWVGLTYTADGGSSWVARKPPPNSQMDFDAGAPTGVANTFFVTAQRGWLTGMDSVWTTNDTGLTWRRQLPGHTYTMAFVGNSGWLAAGDGRSVQDYKTEDQGQSWKPCGTPWDVSKLAPWSSASFINAQDGWITVGSYNARDLPYHGGVARTTDGGCTWKVLWRDSDFTENLLGIQFVDQTTGWLFASYGRLFETTDGGSHWKSVPLPASVLPESAYLVGRGRGWVLGNYGAPLYYTIDGGVTWLSVSLEDIREGRGLGAEIPILWGGAFLLRLNLRR